MNVTRWIGLTVGALVFLVDQLTKMFVVSTLGVNHDLVRAALANDYPPESPALTLLPFFDLRFVPNIGVSLGLMQASSDAMRWGLVALTAAIAAGVVWWMWRERKLGDIVALGMVLGGALGNIVDRTRLGYVVDFADLHFGTWRPFLVFNVADAAITIGVLVLLARALFLREKTPAAQDPVENINA